MSEVITPEMMVGWAEASASRRNVAKEAFDRSYARDPANAIKSISDLLDATSRADAWAEVHKNVTHGQDKGHDNATILKNIQLMAGRKILALSEDGQERSWEVARRIAWSEVARIVGFRLF